MTVRASRSQEDGSRTAWLTSFVRAERLSRLAAQGTLARIFFMGYAGQGVMAGALAIVLFSSSDRAAGEGASLTSRTLGVVDGVLLVVTLVHVGIATVAALHGVRTVRQAARPSHEVAAPSRTPDNRVETARGDRPAWWAARTAALGVVLAYAVLGSTPLWFAAFGAVTGASLAAMVVMAALSASTYAGGFVLCGSLARIVSQQMQSDDVPSANLRS